MAKSPDAFRTIGEVAGWLDTPAHVLRFWESKFTQIRPVKRAGGRRYYRPEDMELLGGIKTLLHDQGMTIKGVQKLLREQGVRHVAAFCAGPLPGLHADMPANRPAAPAPIPAEDDPWPADPVLSRAAPSETPSETPSLPSTPTEPPRPETGLLTLCLGAPPARLRAAAPQLGPLVARLRALRARIAADRG